MRRRLWNAWCSVVEIVEGTGRTLNTDILGPITGEERIRIRQRNQERRDR